MPAAYRPVTEREWLFPAQQPRRRRAARGEGYGDAFEAATLKFVLSGLGVGRVVVAGAQADACVRSTLDGAFVRVERDPYR